MVRRYTEGISLTVADEIRSDSVVNERSVKTLKVGCFDQIMSKNQIQTDKERDRVRFVGTIVE